MKILLPLQMHVLLVLLTAATSPPPSFPIAKPNCTDRCGNVTIPFPFGTTEDCYLTADFLVTCNLTYNPPIAFLQHTNISITAISLDGHLTVLNFVASDCSSLKGIKKYTDYPYIVLPQRWFTINISANKFTVVGCNTYGFVSVERRRGFDFNTGCSTMCLAKDDLKNGDCTGLGCCESSFVSEVRKVNLTLQRYHKSRNNCVYAFVAEAGSFKFSRDSLKSLKNVELLPMVVDWAIEKGIKSANSTCYNPCYVGGYLCSCKPGYIGNPYLVDGCQDIDECQDPNLNKCEHQCKNTPGGYECFCPKGRSGDGKKDGQGCTTDESIVLKTVAGVSTGIIILLLSAFWLPMMIQRRRLIKMRQHFFRQNGGILLEEKLRGKERGQNLAQIFGESELNKATKNFHHSMIIGQGGYGTVYKGVLPDARVVAIKKAKEVPKRVDQFTNEVIVLSQINHRNVVKLLGCCLETRVPLLVYEFISNGTLSEHIHNKAKSCLLSWDTRLRIATETASVLSYLHFSASTPIIHRDVKSSNILLDHNFDAKVSDFGASRLFPLDQTELTTLVQGTFGYLDPEYMQTSQLTEKSDVYSFGVVLVELLTGRKAVSNDRPEEERSLANFFLSVVKEEHLLFQVLEDHVARDGNKEQVMKVAGLAKRCLNVKGDERPCMKEVEMELQGLTVGAKSSSIEIEHIDEERMDSVHGDDGSLTSIWDPSTSTFGFDSSNNHNL